jgi:hypothetical protein
MRRGLRSVLEASEPAWKWRQRRVDRRDELIRRLGGRLMGSPGSRYIANGAIEASGRGSRRLRKESAID